MFETVGGGFVMNGALGILAQSAPDQWDHGQHTLPNGHVIDPPTRDDLVLLQGLACTATLQGAAKSAGMTQPAAMRRFRRLECRVGALLVEQDQHGARLTEAGWCLLHAGNRLLLALGSLLRWVSKNADHPAGLLPVLRLAAFGKDWTDLIDDLAVHLPGMLLSVVNADPETSIELFERHSVDAAYRWDTRGTSRKFTRPVRSTIVLEEPVWVALPADHPRVGETIVSLADLVGEQWIIGTSERDRTLLVSWCRARGFEPRVGHVAECASETRSLLGHRQGVALASPLTVPSVSGSFVLKPLADAPTRIYSLATDPTVISDRLSDALCSRFRRCYVSRAQVRNPSYFASSLFPLREGDLSSVAEPDPELFSGLTVGARAADLTNGEAALEPEDLNLLRVISECGSLNRAAPVLLITQPALTRRIRRLERRLGLSLLLRGHRGTVLTTTARRLLEGAREAESAFVIALAAISERDQPVAHRCS
jgi:DNA-binding transcriptional LysR family regulator